MNTDLIKSKIHYLTKALIVVCLVATAFTAKSVASYVMSFDKVQNAIATAKEKQESGGGEDVMRELLAPKREAASALKMKNMFSPPAPKPNPPVCFGIIGDAAIINDKLYKVGDNVGGAKIVAVGTKDVTIEWEDNEMTLVPFAQQYRESSNGGRPSPPSGGDKKDNNSKPNETNNTPQPPGPSMGPGGFGGGRMFGMSPEDRDAMIERYRSMSPEEQERFREERRREFMDRSGGGFGGSFGGRGGRGR